MTESLKHHLINASLVTICVPLFILVNDTDTRIWIGSGVGLVIGVDTLARFLRYLGDNA